MKKLLPYLLPQPRDILFLGVFFVMVLGGPRLFSNDGDLGRHIAVGEYILTTGTIPTRDIFSHTVRGVQFVPHEWLAQVILALTHRVLGLSGPVFLAACLAAVTILIAYNELVRRGNFRLVALSVTSLVAIVSAVHWLARPHMFTFFFIAIWTYWLERVYKNEAQPLWVFPALMLVWANTHGAYFAGFVVWGTYFAEWLVTLWHRQPDQTYGRKLMLIGVTSFAVTFLNPSGYQLWTTTIGYIGNEFITSRIGDHVSPNFHEADMLPFLLMIVGAVLALAQEKRLALHDALLLAGWLAMGLHTVRNLPLFAVVTAPIYGTLLQAWLKKIPALETMDQPSASAPRGYVWVVVTVAFFASALWRGIPLDARQTGNIFLPDRMPVAAVDWLEEHPQNGNVFNNFTWGGYLLYRRGVDANVFIDGQVDVYGETIFREYLTVMSLQTGWDEILERHNVTWMLLPTNEHITQTLKADQSDAWLVIYEDDTATILSRTP